MIIIGNNQIAEILGAIVECEEKAFEQAKQHEEGSAQHGAWMRVAAALTQAMDEFDR